MKAEHADGYNDMIGNTALLTTVAATPIPATTINVPLRFWFNRNAGLALPLIALQYHEVKFTLEFETLGTLLVGAGVNPAVSLRDASLWVDYVYLARDERRRFAQSAHEYLIEQLQFQGAEVVNGNAGRIRLNLNHPVKELVFVLQQDYSISRDNLEKSLSNFTNDELGGDLAGNPVLEATIQLNGHERFAARDGDYFNLVQPYQHHTRIPPRGINVYSFCEKPEEFQPTGSANFSRIDNANLIMSSLSPMGAGAVASLSTTRTARVYAVNYNVLRVMSGMGGLAFAN
jgi:hypothetical protein